MDIPPILSLRIKTELQFIDPTQDKFWNLDWDSVSFESIMLNERYDKFKIMIHNAKLSQPKPFWKPLYDPALWGRKIVFQKDKNPALGYTILWWERKILKMRKFHGCHWQIGNQDEYVAYLVYLIHKLCKLGFSLKDSVRFIIWNTEEIAYCRTQTVVLPSATGSSGKIEGIDFDLGNSRKILINTSTEKNDFYMSKGKIKHIDYIIAGTSYKNKGFEMPLFNIFKSTAKRKIYEDAVAWIILK